MQNIILLHGALGSAEELISLANILEEHGFFAHYFSFSGHGKVAFADDFTIAQFTSELENFIGEKKINACTIFGYSMGGYVALNLALQHPSLVEKIITLGTKFDWSEAVIEKETKLLNPDLMLAKIPSYAKTLELKHGSNWRELVIRTAQMMKDIGTKNYLPTEKLKTMSPPVLIGLGDKDQLVSLDETSTIYKTLPNGSMCILPNTKHHLESVDLNFLSTIILNFIRNT